MEIIMSLLGAVALGLAVPLGKKLSELITNQINNIKHAGLQQAAWVLVRYAETSFIRSKGLVNQGSNKFDFVYERLQKKFPWAKHAKLEEFIEATVREMKDNWGNAEGSVTILSEPLAGPEST